MTKTNKEKNEISPCVVRYKCASCGNTCLQIDRPDNSICGGCNNPDWKIMKNQQAYIINQKDWIHTNGEI